MLIRLLFVLIIFESAASAQQLRSVRWTGVDGETDLRRTILGGTVLPRDFSTRSELTLEIQRIQRETIDFLHTRGYLLASIDSISESANGDQIDLAIHVSRGRQYVISSISISGQSALIDHDLSALVGRKFDKATLESEIDLLLQRYEAAGFPLARISIASIDVDSIGLRINLRVERGRPALISRITVEGNGSTRPEVITREFGLSPGEMLVPSKLEEGRAALERLGYFEAVEPPQIYLDSDSTVAVHIAVKEARTTTIDAVLGYNPPRSPNEEGYVNGLVDLGFRNIAGTARDAAVHYSSIARGTQRLSAQYREPWVLGLPLHLDASFEQYQQDSSYVTTQITGGASYALSQTVDVSASLVYDRIIPTDLPESPFIAFDSRKLMSLLAASYDSRDELVSPTRGMLLRLSGNYGAKRLNGPDRFLSDSIDRASTVSELALDLSVFQATFTPKLVLALGLHAKRTAVFGSLLDQSDLTRLGGARTLRGYRESELLASRYAYINAEYRLLTARQSYLYLFTDAGWLERAPMINDPATQRLTAISYGLGAQQLTPVGVLSVSIGLAKGESFDRAKVHFGLVTRI